MEKLIKGDLLGYFCSYRVKVLPVVDQNSKIIGVINKEDIVATTTTTDTLNLPIEEAIRTHIIKAKKDDYRILHGLLGNFIYTKKVPTINTQGKIVNFLDKFGLICAWEGISSDFYLGIFAYFPYPVIVTNIDGDILYKNLESEKLFNKSLPQLIKTIHTNSQSKINVHFKFEERSFIYDTIPIKAKENFGEIIVYLIKRAE